jgi:hypothetical protein
VVWVMHEAVNAPLAGNGQQLSKNITYASLCHLSEPRPRAASSSAVKLWAWSELIFSE